MDEEVAPEALAVVSETAPAEKAFRAEGAFGSAVEERGPVDRLFAGVGWNWIDPGAAGRITIPIRLDCVNFAEFAGVINLLGTFIENRRDPLASNLHDAIVLLRRLQH